MNMRQVASAVSQWVLIVIGIVIFGLWWHSQTLSKRSNPFRTDKKSSFQRQVIIRESNNNSSKEYRLNGELTANPNAIRTDNGTANEVLLDNVRWPNGGRTYFDYCLITRFGVGSPAACDTSADNSKSYLVEVLDEPWPHHLSKTEENDLLNL